MNRFVEFEAEDVAAIAGSIKQEASESINKILRELVENIPLLVAAAHNGHPPIVAIESMVVSLLEDPGISAYLRPAEVLEIIARAVTHVLSSDGFEPVRAEPAFFGAERHLGQKIYYYRPAERTLFDTIDLGQPVILATTVDTRRFGRAMVKRYVDSARSTRRVFVWTIASGLFEVTQSDSTIEYFQAGDPNRYRCNVESITLSSFCDELGIGREEFVMSMNASGAEFQVEDDMRFLIRANDSGSDHDQAVDASLQLVVDDCDDDGNLVQPNEATLDRVKENVANSWKLRSAINDRWPRPDSEPTPTFMALPALIGFIMQRQTRDALFIVYDGEVFLDQKEHGGDASNIAAAYMRDACVRLRRAATGTQIVVLSAPINAPVALNAEVTQIDLPLPSRQELLAEVRRRQTPGSGLFSLADDPTQYLQSTDGLLGIVDAAAGMTLTDVANAIRRAIHNGSTDDAQLVLAINEAKRTAIRRSAALELLHQEPPRELMLGGMERFWSWLETRHRVFKFPELASHFGIDKRPKGVLLLGIPGTGKSLAAKLIAREWQVPLVRLDMGALQNRWVGASEERIREALQIVQAISPCVMWIDEIDKGIAQGEGTGSHSTDLNIRATLLTWLQEHDSAVYVVATANRFKNLPPELTRAGRFDARFFFGCPNLDGCREILKIHLDLRRVTSISIVQLDEIASAMHGFTGAEIEQAVLDALYEAFAENRPVTAADLKAAASRVKPIIKAAGAGLDEAWSLIEEGRVELASDNFLSRTDLAKLINPESFSPMYCRLNAIGNWEKHGTRAGRLLMRDQFGLPAAVVLDTGDDAWIYVHTNFKQDTRDEAHFKFFDRLAEIDRNGVFDRLVVEFALETIWFENEAALKRFTDCGSLSAYGELCRVLTENKENEADVTHH